MIKVEHISKINKEIVDDITSAIDNDDPLRLLLSLKRLKQNLPNGEWCRECHVPFFDTIYRPKDHTMAQIFIDEGMDLDIVDFEEWSPTHFAVLNKDHVLLEMLLKANPKGSHGTAFRLACADNRTDTVRIFLKHGIDLTADYVITSFGEACELGHEDVVELLIRSGIDINNIPKNHLSPLMLACQQGRTNIVKLLLENGADVNITRHRGNALFYTDGNIHADVMKRLLDAGVDKNSRDSDGGTYLHHMARKGSKFAVVYLIDEYGFNSMATDNENRTAHDVAYDAGHGWVCELLAARMENTA